MNDRPDARDADDRMEAMNVREVGLLDIGLLRFRGKINAKRRPSLHPQFRQDRGADQAGRASHKRHISIHQSRHPF